MRIYERDVLPRNVICYICVNLHRLCQFSSIMHRRYASAEQFIEYDSWHTLVYIAHYLHHATYAAASITHKSIQLFRYI